MTYINNDTKTRLRWVFEHLVIDSPYGRRCLSEIEYYCAGDEERLRNSFDILKGIVSCLRSNRELFGNFNRMYMELRNICGSIENLKSGLTLSETELFEIKNFAIIANNIKELALKKEIFVDKFVRIDISRVICLLNPETIVTRSFYIHESWSEKLKNIRNEKRIIEEQILSAVSDEEKQKLRLLRSRIVNAEKDEELVVRKRLSESLKEYVDILNGSIDCIGNLELLLAKAKLAIDYDCSQPEIYEADDLIKAIEIKNAIEPDIAENLKTEGKKFTPVNIQIQRGVTLLTGANMGGKTVALTTIALNVELVRLGFLPFAEKVALRIPDFIEVIAGDNQDVKAGLSSFGSDIKRLGLMLKKLESGHGLVICDEFGRSTNPYEGSRFVQTLGEKLQNSDSYGIIATHYDGVKTAGAAYYQVAGLRDIDVDNLIATSDIINLSECMDYNLIRISENSQIPYEALNIAKLLGLPRDFIEQLEKKY